MKMPGLKLKEKDSIFFRIWVITRILKKIRSNPFPNLFQQDSAIFPGNYPDLSRIIANLDSNPFEQDPEKDPDNFLDSGNYLNLDSNPHDGSFPKRFGSFLKNIRI